MPGARGEGFGLTRAHGARPSGAVCFVLMTSSLTPAVRLIA